MSRGEYRSVGDSVARLPEAEGPYRSYADVFVDRVNDLDAAIQQADRDYATTHQTDFRPNGERAGRGIDQSEFVYRYWLPFMHAWSAARATLLRGTIDRAAALVLASWAARYNELRMSAGGSWGLDTSAPHVVIKGEIGDTESQSKTPWWKKAAGAAAVLGVGYLMLVRPRRKADERRLAASRQLAADVGLRYGMTEDEIDRAFDAYYEKQGYPSYLRSSAPKFTR